MTQLNVPIEKQDLKASGTGARMLENKCVVMFGAGGSIGAAVAREFAAEGARVFLTGRTASNLKAVAEQINRSGGAAQTSTIDVLDEGAGNRYLDSIVKQTGKLDIVIDVTGPLAKEYGNGKIAVELPVEEFIVPLTTIVKARFVTAVA